MTVSRQSEITGYLDDMLPVSSVLRQAKAFLLSCGWKLEINEEFVAIEENTELAVRSRSFVTADLPCEVFIDDHFEAVVLIGTEEVGENIVARYGVLKMYFNLEGQFVSEDRYDKYH